MKFVVLALGLVAFAATAAARPALKNKEHSTERNGIKLALYEKWQSGEESKWKANGKVVLLVHGATWSSRCTFDAVPGYSLMDTLAEDGWDVWAVDLHGYGNSQQSERDWTEASAAVADLDTAVDYIRAFRWVDRVAVYGYQWGSQAAALFASQKPNKVTRLALFGMRYKLFDKTPAPTTPMRSNTSAQATLKPEDGDLDPAMVHKRAEVCTLSDPRSPNGALKDIARASGVDPQKLTVPTLVLSAERDGDAQAADDREDFFRAVAAHGKWFVSLAGLGKHAPIERGRARFDRALLGFLDAP